MIASLLSAFLFSLSAIYGAKSARVFGAAKANLGRVCVAFVLLAAWAFIFGKGLHGAALVWFIFGGCVGFGLGDAGLFGALPRIGPRLSILLTQCLAWPIAGLAEWFWLGQAIPAGKMIAAAVILAGVIMAFAPGRNGVENPGHHTAGIIFGLLSALGQGLGAVISRKANEVNLLAGTPIDGGTAAFQRMIGGIVFTVILYLFLRRRNGLAKPGFHGWHLMVINGVVGPSIGVGFFQFALTTTPSALVLALVATSPVIVMLLQIFSGEEKPGLVSIFGGCVAVAGAVALALL